MTDVQLDVLVASTSPISDRAVAALSLNRVEQELLEAILTLPQAAPLPPAAVVPIDRRPPDPADDAWVASRSDPDRRPSGHRHRRRRVLAVLGVAAAMLVAAVVWQQSGTDRPSGVVSQPPDESSVDPADEPPPSSVDPLRADWPKLIVDRPGWTMTEVSVSGEPPDNVYVRFTNGPRFVGLSWVPLSGLAPRAGDPAGQDELGPVQVLGYDAVLHAGHDNGEYFMATWYPDADHVMWASGFGFATSDEFVELLSGLRPVDPDAFYAARPADHISPGDQPAVIDELLTGVPAPPVFQASPPVVSNGGMGVPKVQLARVVVDSVVCGWARIWDLATDAGDTAKAQEAAAAMTAAAAWPVIDQLDQGPSNVEYLRQKIGVAAGEMTAGRVPSPSQQQWEDEFDCE
jgi:hypothetical protein